MIRSYYHLALVGIVAVLFLSAGKGDSGNLFWQYAAFVLTLLLVPWDLAIVAGGRWLISFAAEIQTVRGHVEGKLLEMKKAKSSSAGGS